MITVGFPENRGNPGSIRARKRAGWIRVAHGLHKIPVPGGTIPQQKIRQIWPRIPVFGARPFPENPIKRPDLLRMENRLKSGPFYRNTPGFDGR